MIADVEKETQDKMQQAVDHAREDLSTIRTGRAHPAMFNRLNADYYGAPTPLQQLATFNSPRPPARNADHSPSTGAPSQPSRRRSVRQTSGSTRVTTGTRSVWSCRS